jgi:hypothetical protein
MNLKIETHSLAAMGIYEVYKKHRLSELMVNHLYKYNGISARFELHRAFESFKNQSS